MSITYAITVCNELDELTRLVNFLHPRIHEGDEILIQYDADSVSSQVKQYIDLLDSMHGNVNVIGFPLNREFAAFKNNLKLHANGMYIFQIDADELPSEYLVASLHDIIDANKNVDLFFVPRINTVDGLTDADITRWAWAVNDKGWVNFPDLQTRLYRRTSDIEWVGAVHERIKGYNTFSLLPFEEQYCLYHPKTIERQRKQNDFYETI